MSIFSDLKPRNNASRNAFDRSCRQVFSNKLGNIRTALQLPVIPSSEIEIDMQQLMRTQPLSTAAFTGAQVNYDFVFVPYNHLYSSFNQFIAQRECAELANQPDAQEIPWISLGQFLEFLIPAAVYDYITHAYTFAEFSLFNDLIVSYDGQPLAYSLVDSNHGEYSVALSCISQLDMLGYGNYLPIVKQLASCVMEVSKDAAIPLDGVPENITNFLAFFAQIMGITGEDGDYLDDFATYFLEDSDFDAAFSSMFGFSYIDYVTAFTNYSVSLWPVLAYNKCFYEYYRNQYYDEHYFLTCNCIYLSEGDRSEYDFKYVQLFNFDDFQSYDGSSFAGVMRIFAMFAEKPHLYKRDLFTGVLPSTQFGSVSMMSTDNTLRRLLYVDSGLSSSSVIGRSSVSSALSLVPLNSDGSVASNTNGSKLQSAKFQFDPALAISVLEARQADALQRFKERMMRAGDKTKDIFEAHGWTKPKSQSAFEPVFLGSYDGSLDINTVAATSESDGIDLGQLAANGVGTVRGSKIRFSSSDFGVVLCLQYIIKSAEYDAYGVDKTHTLLEAFDFPYPELQNISLAPLSGDQLNIVSPFFRDNQTKLPNEQILGYLPRSFEYKTNVDRVHGEFYSLPILIDPRDKQLSALASALQSGVFSNWVASRKNIWVDLARSLEFLYVSINDMDGVFKVNANSLPDTDQFLFNVQFNIKAVQPLPVIGLPI